jgi:uncharacterized membrane protein
MDPVAAIAFWSAMFLGTHLIISSARVRPILVGAIGEQPYRGVYSLAAFVTFIPMVVVFAHHKHSGPMLWYLRDIDPVRWLAWLLMLLALIFLFGGLINPNPGAIGAPTEKRVTGILKITRHPSFVAFILFGLAHILMNGWLGDVIFFSVFPALGILGGIHQDGRKLRDLGDGYRKFLDQTSFLPGAALLGGRQRWNGADIPWAALGIGIAATILIVMLHPMLFGGSPLG